MKKIIFVGTKLDVLEKLKFFTTGLDITICVVDNLENAIIQIKKDYFDWCIIAALKPEYQMNAFFEKASAYIRNTIIIFDVIGYEKPSIFYGKGTDFKAITITFRLVCPEIDMVTNIETHYRNEINKKIFSGDLCIDITHKSIIKNGKMIHMSNMEFNLCQALLQSSGLIMPRGLLLESLWDSNLKFIEDNTLSVHISRLRKKLGHFEDCQYIETIKGIGYRWNIKTTLRV